MNIKTYKKFKMEDNYYNYEIIKNNLCLSMFVYTYDPKKKQIDDHISNLYQSDDIQKDLKNIESNEIFIKYFENSRGLGCLLSLNHIRNTITLTFKGTDDLIDMFYNLQTIKHSIIPHDLSRIHNGFIRILSGDNIHDDILSEIKNLSDNYPNYEIFITGHSLGGSLSIVFSYFIHDKVDKHINVITFGCTKIGNYHFSLNYNNIKNINLVRVCNKKDMITSLPIVNYYHVGKVIQLNDNDITKYHSSNSSYLNDFIIFKRSFECHYSKNYYLNLERLKNCF